MILAVPTDNTAAVEGPPQGQWTALNWDRLDHQPDTRYEIIDGVLYVSRSPSAFHQWILFRLMSLVGTPAYAAGLAYPFFAPIGLFMPGCDPVQPDFVLILKDRALAQDMIRERGIFGVPDLIVEVLSPGTAAYDEGVKLRAYAQAGVPEYVIIDPQLRGLRHGRLAQQSYLPLTSYSEQDLCAFDCTPQFPFRVGDLFAGMPGGA